MKSTTTQTILFERSLWTAKAARAWLRKHKKLVGWLDETEHHWRFRQVDPDLFDRTSFRTVTLRGHAGIKIVVGHLL